MSQMMTRRTQCWRCEGDTDLPAEAGMKEAVAGRIRTCPAAPCSWARRDPAENPLSSRQHSAVGRLWRCLTVHID